MQARIKNIISFYRDCYQFEYSTEKVSNFYAASVTHLYYPESFELLSKLAFELPVDTDWGNKVSTELKLESSEKKMVCGSFFLKGKLDLLGRSHKIFTPLFLNDANLDYSNEVYFLEIDHDSLSLNPIAINYLNSLDENYAHSIDDLSKELLDGKDIFSFSGLVRLQELLKSKYPILNTQLITDRMKSEQRLSQLDLVFKSRKSEFGRTIFPDILIGLTEKPIKSKDVINELTELSQRICKDSSVLYNVLLGRNFEKSPSFSSKKQEIVVPVSLSESQEKIITSLNRSNASVVIGPPGTGKSFSIAALAIQAFQEGKKVLIASKNEQACQIINNKIENDIGIKGITVNSSKARYRMTVATKIRNFANGIGLQSIAMDRLNKIEKEVIHLKELRRNTIDKIVQRESTEKNWGEKLTNNSESLFLKIQKKWIKYRHGQKEPIWDLNYQLHDIDARLKKKEKQLIKLTYRDTLNQLLSVSRPEIKRFEKVFKETRGNVIKDIFSSIDFNIVLKALPIWICKSVDIANIVPLEEGLFDLLIIDEASQCDIASSIPLIYRAKSIVIVGDPNQLRHISFISNHKEKITKEKYELTDLSLSYRDKSILDQVNEAINSQDNVIFLDEHFRSMPDIINFSNNQFYSSQLKIMTDRLIEKEYDNLIIKVVEKGERNTKGENYFEAKEIIDAVKDVIDQEIALSNQNCSTIGVISPFTFQVKLLKKIIKEAVDTKAIVKHKILIGTPFKFQGEERDFVYLSLTIDENTHHGSLRYLERPDVFNVSITRAKKSQEVFISIDPNKLKKESLLSKYFFAKVENDVGMEDKLIYDQFLEEVRMALKTLKAEKCYINRKVCGTKLDLVLVQEDRTIGIDLIGFPGEYSGQLTMNDIMSLERAEIEIFLLPYSAWHFDKELCLGALAEFVQN